MVHIFSGKASLRKKCPYSEILVRIYSECGKIQTRITPNTGTFHPVHILRAIRAHLLVYLYLQRMINLENTNNKAYLHFKNCSFLTSRSESYWIELPNDLVIEQVFLTEAPII